MNAVPPVKPPTGARPPAAALAQKNVEAERRLLDACSRPEEDALAHLGSTANGLSGEEAQRRLAEFGPNNLAEVRKSTFLRDIYERAKNPLVIQLLIIGAVSFAMGDLRSGLVVSAMICLSVLLASFQESKSTRAVEELHKMIHATSMVRRDGREGEIPLSLIVPGDILVLAAGDIIPADVRILTAKDFYVSQSTLTGESMPVEKSSPAVTAPPAELFEYANACFQGSTVVSGAARAVVVNTGLGTYLGALSRELAAAPEITSYDRGVKSFVWLMVRFMVVMVSATFMIVGITKGDWLQALLFALSVAVGLTPEMLPMIMTVCLSKGALVMSRKKVIVKHLSAIQNLGAMDVLCTDKTGTLTQDRIVLEKYVDVANRSSEDVLRYAYLNSHYQTGLRSLLDNAVLAHEDLEVERTARKVDEIPFDFTRKRMSVVIDYEETHVLICKGAVEDIYSVCDRYQIDEDIYPLISMIKDDLIEEYQSLSAEGYRVLAVAYREFPNDRETFSPADESNLILLGYIAFFDPPKDSALWALQALKESGVKVKILTGDNELVTRKICRDVGLLIDREITGRELNALDEAGFAAAVEEANVFSRLTPSQKERIIKTLKGRGHVVGFLGDGINDAPAMKAADVGISVDTAADVAKESADIILLEKSLRVLQDGIIEGRKIFGNITKYIKMGASSNFGNMFSVVGGSAFLPFLPMAPIQVLANNLLYDISQVGIPTDRVDAEYLARPRQWNINMIKKFMVFIGPMSSIFDYATFFLMLYVFGCRGFSLPGTAPALKVHYEQLFHTGWFVESLLTQTLIVHIIRTRRIPFFQSRASTALSLTTLAVMAAAVYLPYSALAPVLGLVPLPAVYWLWIAGFLASYCILTHLVKSWFYRKYGMD